MEYFGPYVDTLGKDRKTGAAVLYDGDDRKLPPEEILRHLVEFMELDNPYRSFDAMRQRYVLMLGRPQREKDALKNVPLPRRVKGVPAPVAYSKGKSTYAEPDQEVHIDEDDANLADDTEVRGSDYKRGGGGGGFSPPSQPLIRKSEPRPKRATTPVRPRPPLSSSLSSLVPIAMNTALPLSYPSSIPIVNVSMAPEPIAQKDLRTAHGGVGDERDNQRKRRVVEASDNTTEDEWKDEEFKGKFNRLSAAVFEAAKATGTIDANPLRIGIRIHPEVALDAMKEESNAWRSSVDQIAQNVISWARTRYPLGPVANTGKLAWLLQRLTEEAKEKNQTVDPELVKLLLGDIQSDTRTGLFQHIERLALAGVLAEHGVELKARDQTNNERVVELKAVFEVDRRSLQATIDNLQERVHLAGEPNDLTAKVTELESKLAESKRVLAETTSKFKAHDIEREGKRKKDAKDLKEKYNALVVKHNEQLAARRESETMRDRAQDQRDVLIGEQERSNTEMAGLRQTIAAYTSTVATNVLEKGQMEERLAGAQAESKAADARIDGLREALEEERKSLRQTTGQLAEANLRLVAIEGERDASIAEARQLRVDEERLNSHLEVATERAETLARQRDDFERQLSSSLDGKSGPIDKANQEIARLTTVATKATDTLATAEANYVATLRSANNMIDDLKDEAEKMKLEAGKKSAKLSLDMKRFNENWTALTKERDSLATEVAKLGKKNDKDNKENKGEKKGPEGEDDVSMDGGSRVDDGLQLQLAAERATVAQLRSQLALRPAVVVHDLSTTPIDNKNREIERLERVITTGTSDNRHLRREIDDTKKSLDVALGQLQRSKAWMDWANQEGINMKTELAGLGKATAGMRPMEWIEAASNEGQRLQAELDRVSGETKAELDAKEKRIKALTLDLFVVSDENERKTALATTPVSKSALMKMTLERDDLRRQLDETDPPVDQREKIVALETNIARLKAHSESLQATLKQRTLEARLLATQSMSHGGGSIGSGFNNIMDVFGSRKHPRQKPSAMLSYTLVRAALTYPLWSRAFGQYLTEKLASRKAAVYGVMQQCGVGLLEAALIYASRTPGETEYVEIQELIEQVGVAFSDWNQHTTTEGYVLDPDFANQLIESAGALGEQYRTAQSDLLNDRTNSTWWMRQERRGGPTPSLAGLVNLWDGKPGDTLEKMCGIMYDASESPLDNAAKVLAQKGGRVLSTFFVRK